ncbi:hypothetical protein Agub_g12655 [Astrephomene gubernaculifera]|uniref:ODAD1 central coiled coil region domain-containing protein n=1 Tax=Astrephomene gubernaculifera TaxID=47775 RepID=A0AAD3HQU2_9CHLO|nr:hypothetical protein Agub_g12655 [Astrephomene gubernaculifera]
MASSTAPLVHELQARIRELEATRKSRTEEASRIIASQRTTIDRLRSENQRLAADLAAVGSADAAAIAALVATGAAAPSVMVKPTGLTPAQTERADRLMEVADTYNRKIEVEQRQLESLEREVELAQAQLLAARRDMGGYSGAKALTVAPVKAIKALETRLDGAQRRFNEHIAANRDLKQQIDAATRRQAGLEQVRSQLDREVASLAGEVAALQEGVRVAQEARQEAMAQIAALRVAEDAEAAAFEVEVRELAACQAADERLLQAQAVRLTKAVEAAEAAGEAAGSPKAAAAGAAGAEGLGSGGGGAAAAGGLGTVSSSSVIATPAEPLDLDLLEQGVGVEAAALQLQRAAGLSSLPETLSHYSSLEQLSFDLFSACNEANERIAALGREVRQMEAELRQMESDAVAGRQHEAIRQVLARRDAAVRRGEALTERRSALDRRIAMLRTGIYTCLRKLGAAAAAQAWEASAPSATSSSSGASAAAAAAVPSPPPHPSVAACAHVMAGLAVLEQRAAAVIAVQGTMVGRSSSLSRQGAGGGPGSRPPSGPPSSSAAAAQQRRPSASAAGTAAAAAAAAGQAATAAINAPATSNGGGGSSGGGAGGGGREYELINESDEEDEVPLTREQIQARSASIHRTE